jgi:flagellar hook-associated protein 2
MPAVTGLGSGLDIEGLVSGLIAAESTPQLSMFAQRTEKASLLLSGLGEISSVLASLQVATQSLSSADTFAAVTSLSSAPTYATVSAEAGAAAGSYDLEVTRLAATQSLVSGNFAASTTEIGTGTLTITLGTPTYNVSPADTTTYASFAADSGESAITVNIASGEGSLAEVRDAINAATDKVSASIVKNGLNYQLLLSPTESGLDNSISISVADGSDVDNTDNAGLSQLAFNSSTSNLSQTKAASNAQFSLNGIALVSESNTVEDVIDDVDVTLLQQTTSPVVLSLLEDTTFTQNAVSAFIDAYNAYVEKSSGLTAYTSSTGTAGPLLGDFTTRTLSDQVRAQLSATIASATGTYSSLSEIGIEVQTGGKLKLNTTTFQAAMAADPTSVQAIFVDRTDIGSTLTGFASSMDTVLESFTSSTGAITDRTSSIQDQIEEISSEQTKFITRMEGAEARYRSQFNALDSLLAEIQATQDYLTTALDQLPGFVRKET